MVTLGHGDSGDAYSRRRDHVVVWDFIDSSRHGAWELQLLAAINSDKRGFATLIANGPPTSAMLEARSPTVAVTRNASHLAEALVQYDLLNATLFSLIFERVDFVSRPTLTSVVKGRFVRGAKLDGVGLFHWAMEMADQSRGEKQETLRLKYEAFPVIVGQPSCEVLT